AINTSGSATYFSCNAAASTASYPLSLHDALPIFTLTGDITAQGGAALGTNRNGGTGGAVTFQDPVVLNAATVTIDTRPGAFTGTDRKSTRLNSSHVEMSYAAAGVEKLTLIAGDTG